MRNTRFIEQIPAAQRGAVLIVSLIILLLMTIIGVTAMTTNTQEEKMAGNARNRDLAFQAAESVLRGRRRLVDAGLPILPNPVSSCSGPPCDVWQTDAPGGPSSADLAAQNQPGGRRSSEGVTIPGRADDASALGDAAPYILEYLDFVPDSLAVGTRYPATGREYYELSGRGTGAADVAQVLVQSTYVRRY